MEVQAKNKKGQLIFHCTVHLSKENNCAGAVLRLS